MLVFSKFLSRLSLITAISFLNVGCAETKIIQCNSIIAIANNVAEEARILTEGGQTQDPQAMLQAADVIEQAAQEMKILEIQDVELQEYREGFVKMYQGISQSTRSFVSAFNNQDRDAAQTAQQGMQEATQSEPELVQGINNYCMGEE